MKNILKIKSDLIKNKEQQFLDINNKFRYVLEMNEQELLSNKNIFKTNNKSALRMKFNKIIKNKLTGICLLFLIASCQRNSEKHELLIDFSINLIDPEGLREINTFKELGYFGRPREIKIRQNRDTLFVGFKIFEAAASKIEGNIEIKKDSLFLKIGKGEGIRELVTHEYEYKIYNPERKEFKIKINKDYGIEDL